MAAGPVRHGNGTTTLGHPPMAHGADGRWVHTFRQSMVGTYLDCPERARREIYGLVDRVENDAASVGTAFHAVAEDAVNLLGEDGIQISADDCVDLFDVHWDQMCNDMDIQWVKRKHPAATKYGRKIAHRFGEHVLGQLEPFAVEVGFGPIQIHEDETRVIVITGSIDYVDQRLGLVDWKSASRLYEKWEKQRWAIQPSFYDYGFRAVVDEMVGYDGEPYRGPLGEWNYCVFPDIKQPEVQWVPVTRTPAHTDWLREQLVGIAQQLEATEAGYLTEWVKRDQHALCSSRWCPAHSSCKGVHVEIK